MAILIHQSTARIDNFVVLVHDEETKRTVAIDASDEESVEAALKTTGWPLSDILVTHKHLDHIEGIPALKRRYGAHVVAPAKSHGLIPDVDQEVRDGDVVQCGPMQFTVWETPGHCADHVSYLLPQADAAFVGDTLFALGCGRVLEQTPAVLYASLMRLATLPETTSIYCGHEYTLSNARFSVTIEPDNAALKARAAEIEMLRQAGQMTLPTTIAAEKATNVFLRATSAERFAELRDAKNRF